MKTSATAVLLALVATLAAINAQTSSTISTTNLPKRMLTVTGAQISTTAYLEGGLYRKVLPLDDPLLDPPEIALLCYSPWISPKNWSMFVHMPTVDTPIAYYYPLKYSLGDWKYEYGDTAVCKFERFLIIFLFLSSTTLVRSFS